MIDFQIVYPQTVVNLSSVTFLEAAEPRLLQVVGDDFSSVDEVRINGIASPSVSIFSSSILFAQVPDTVVERVTSVTVLSNKLLVQDRNLLTFRLGRSPAKVSGVLRLLQVFIKLLFTTPGTDIWSQSSGGGALQGLGRNINDLTGQGTIQDFMIAVANTTRQLVATQARNTRLPPDERLLSATVTKVFFNKQESALIPTIEVVSQLGVPAQASFSLLRYNGRTQGVYVREDHHREWQGR